MGTRRKGTPPKIGIRFPTEACPPIVPEILLHPQIPQPLHGVNPRTVRGNIWWQGERRQALQESHGYCMACGVHRSKAKYHRWLECHEQYNIYYDLGKMVYIKAVAICHSCHNFIHRGRLEALYRQRKISKQKYIDIINHGTAILKKYGLKPISFSEKKVAPWDDWRLVIGPLEYPPISRSEWTKRFGMS